MASALALGTIGLAAQAGTASAGLYWGEGFIAPWSIGHAALDGSGADRSFAYPGLPVESVAVNADHIYWSALSFQTIGRADRDGKSVNPHFITTPAGVLALAIDKTHVYWAGSSGTIGRVDLDGSNQSPAFIDTGSGQIGGLAVAGGHVYWTKPWEGRIGRAGTDGTDIQPDLIDGLGMPQGIAVGGGQVFWAAESDDAIGRANIDGSDVQPALVAASDPRGMAHHAGYIYWTASPGAIGRAAVDGTGASAGLVSGIAYSYALAAVAEPVWNLAPSVAALDLGSAALGSLGLPQSFSLANGGTTAVEVDRVRVAGADPGDFVVARDDCSRTRLKPGESCAVAVRFGPTGVGARSASLELTSNAPGGPVTVAASGQGVAPALPSAAGTSGPSAAAGARVVKTRCTSRTRRVKVPLRAKRHRGAARRAAPRHRWVKKRVTRCVRRVAVR